MTFCAFETRYYLCYQSNYTQR